MLWKTKDGQVIPIEEMTSQHLRNAISYLERRPYSQYNNTRLWALRAELERRCSRTRHFLASIKKSSDTQNLRVLPIEQMETKHLQNAIAHLERRQWGSSKEARLEELRRELERRKTDAEIRFSLLELEPSKTDDEPPEKSDAAIRFGLLELD